MLSFTPGVLFSLRPLLYDSNRRRFLCFYHRCGSVGAGVGVGVGVGGVTGASS